MGDFLVRACFVRPLNHGHISLKEILGRLVGMRPIIESHVPISLGVFTNHQLRAETKPTLLQFGIKSIHFKTFLVKKPKRKPLFIVRRSRRLLNARV
jgi:hypothetical protein